MWSLIFITICNHLKETFPWTFIKNEKILVAKFEEYVEGSLKNWKWLEQGRINSASTHWAKRLKKLTDQWNRVRMNREEAEGGHPEEQESHVTRLCSELVWALGPWAERLISNPKGSSEPGSTLESAWHVVKYDASKTTMITQALLRTRPQGWRGNFEK